MDDERQPPGRRRRVVAAAPLLAVFLALFTTFFCVAVIQYWDGPVIGGGDLGTYTFASFYFARHLEWLPVPHLELQSDWTLYPHGIDQVFLHWSFERDYFFLLAERLTGSGSWYQVYFLLSMLVTVIGAFVIVRRRLPLPAAGLVAFAVSFGNYYAIRKFPTQLPLACVHWATLGILLDFLLVDRMARRRPWSARLVLARLVTLVLSLGLDLGYIAGFSLLSFTVAMTWVAILGATHCRCRPAPLLRRLARALDALARSGRARPIETLLLLVALVAGLWLYLTPVLQVTVASARYDFSGVDRYVQSEHPLRILLPHLPGVDLGAVSDRLGDRGEYIGPHFSPGLSFVLAALAGVILGRRRWRSFLPALVVFALLLFFDPIARPTLDLFPWFRFARAPGRATAVFPALLCALALSLPLGTFVRRGSRLTALLLAVFFSVEMLTAYRDLTSSKFDLGFYFDPEPGLMPMMETIRQRPGEALFEWPFVVSPRGGALSRYVRQLKGVGQFTQFHRKKLLGANYTRMHPDQIAEFEALGWSRVLARSSSAAENGHREFGDEERAFLESYYRLNDFCGILLYADLVEPETEIEFHTRFGDPIAETLYQPVGRLQFIPKPAAWRSDVDPVKGRAVRLAEPG